MTAQTIVAEGAAPAPPGPLREFWGYFSSNRGAVAGLVVVITVLLMIALTQTAKRHLHRQGVEHGVPHPQQTGWFTRAAAALGSLSWMLLFYGFGLHWPIALLLVLWGFGGWAWVWAGISFIACAIMCASRLLPGLSPARRGQYAFYHGTLARSLAPVYALAILLTAALTLPYLQLQEQHWIKQDRLLIYPGQYIRSFTPMEERATRDLCQLLQQATGKAH
jgi:hypothetical protein